MGLFSGQLASVVEWEEYRDDVIFWKWSNGELKKSSRLILRMGQDAVFLYNGRIEGIFTEEGNYEIESQIIPFLSTLKGFKFGFNSGLRAEVLFVNTKEFTVKWGTRGSINIPAAGLPGGLPVRAFGTFTMKVGDYVQLIDKIAGIKAAYTVDEVRDRVIGVLDQLLMKWIVREGKDMWNLQANASEISGGIRQDLDMELCKIGLTVTGFAVSSFNYPEEVQQKIDQTASYHMVGDVGRYQQVSMADAMTSGKGSSSSAADMMGAVVGMQAAMNIMNGTSAVPSAAKSGGQSISCAFCGAQVDAGVRFCPECGKNPRPAARKCPKCGADAGSAKFCPECGTSLVPAKCPKCGADTGSAKFCPECGEKLV